MAGYGDGVLLLQARDVQEASLVAILMANGSWEDLSQGDAARTGAARLCGIALGWESPWTASRMERGYPGKVRATHHTHDAEGPHAMASR